ncbi:MAG: extracellular solute-binding protein [Clostridia bacterium]|nr:extracellular solute-binding protein [Clostridia bacterium]
MKKILSILMSLLMVFALAGCHGGAGLSDFEIPEGFDASKQYEITFWAKNDTNINQTRIYENAIKEFEKIYPNIKITMKLYTDYGRIYNDVITNIATNTTPNVCITYPDHIATYLTGSNIVVPLDELLTDPQYGLGGSEVKFDAPTKDEIVPKFLDECRIGEHYYALPYMRSTEACYINKDMVEKLGYEVPDVLTWDFIFEVSDKAMEQDAQGNYKINGQKVLIPFIYKSTDNMMIQMLKQKGAGYSDDQGNIELFNDTTKQILLEITEHAKKKSFSTFKISSYPGNFLNAGQCIFAIDSTAGATWMGSHAPLSDIAEDKKVEFETVVRPVPQYDVNDLKMISQGPSMCLFNKADRGEVLASWLFMQYLLTNDVQIGYSKTEGYVPVTTKAQQDKSYTDYLNHERTDEAEFYSVKLDASKLLIDNIDNTFVTPVFNGSASLRDASGQMIEDVVKSVNRKKTVDDAYIDSLFEDMNSLYRLDQKNTSAIGEKDLGPLPTGSKFLIGAIIIAWIFIALYYIQQFIKKKRAQAR